jgi:hypothetical protein
MEWKRTSQDARQEDDYGSKDSENCNGEEKGRSRVFLANPERRFPKIL